MKVLIHLPLIALTTTLFSTPVTAQTAEDYHPFLSDKFNIGVGLFWPDKSATVRVDGTVPEEEIDFDEALGFDDYETTPSLMMRWRFGEKWSFFGQYWSTDSSNGAELTEDIEWEDVVFKEGTFAKGGIDSKLARIFFGRTFSAGPKYEFGAGAGIHWMEVDIFIEGEIIIDDDSTGFHRESVDAGFPLPNIGAWYLYSWSPKWLFQARLDWLSVSIGDYSGGLWNSQMGIHWQTFKNIGFGLYYNRFNLDLDVDKNDWHGKAEFTHQGPYLALTATW